MPKFIVSQYHTCVVSYEVEANSEEHAAFRVLSGEREGISEVNDVPDVIEPNDDIGLPKDENEHIWEYFMERGVVCSDSHIDSLASVKAV